MKGEKYILDPSFSSESLNSKQTERETQKNCLEVFAPLSSTGHWFSFCESIIEIMSEIITYWNYLSEDCYGHILSKSQNHYHTLIILDLSSLLQVLGQLFCCQDLNHTLSCIRIYLRVLSVNTLA